MKSLWPALGVALLGLSGVRIAGGDTIKRILWNLVFPPPGEGSTRNARAWRAFLAAMLLLGILFHLTGSGALLAGMGITAVAFFLYYLFW